MIARGLVKIAIRPHDADATRRGLTDYCVANHDLQHARSLSFRASDLAFVREARRGEEEGFALRLLRRACQAVEDLRHFLAAVDRVWRKWMLVVEHGHLLGRFNRDLRQVLLGGRQVKVFRKERIHRFSFGRPKVVSFVGEVDALDEIARSVQRINALDKGKTDLREIACPVFAAAGND